MTFEITIKPSDHAFACEADETVLASAMRADLLLPYGCRNGACGIVQGTHSRRRGRLRPAPGGNAHRRRKAHGPGAVLLRQTANRPGDRGARGAPRRRHRDQAPALPHRVDRQGRARRGDRALQAPRQRAAAVPRRPVRRLPAEGRQAAQLLARHAAARRQAAGAPRPARAGRLLHRSALHAVQGSRDPALRGPARFVLSARGLRQADRVRRRRHRLRADQGDDRARALSQARSRDGALLGRTLAAGSVPARTARPVADRTPQLHVHPGAVGTSPRRRVAGPHRLRAPGGARRLSRSVGLPGLRVRRSADDRSGAPRFRRTAAALPEHEFYADSFTYAAETEARD